MPLHHAMLAVVFSLCAFLILPAALAEDAQSTSGEILEACPLPEKPTIPNGRTSTEAEMIAAHGAMQAYVAAGNRVLDCLGQVEAGWDETAGEEQRAIVVLFHNKMVDEMKSVADLFNAAVRAYKGKTQ